MSKRKEATKSVFDRYLDLHNNINTTNSQDDLSCKPDLHSVLDCDERELLAVLKTYDWSFSNDDTTYLSHDIHPYPAKFAPQLPAQLIKLLSNVGEYIWDPFGGSGTTALEALLCDRSCISTDINPIGSIIGKAKTTALCEADEQQINKFIANLEYYSDNPICLSEYFETNKALLEKEIPNIPNIEKWFDPTVICELAFLKHLLKTELLSQAARTVALASLSKIITKVSNQENETTYRAIDKGIKTGDTLRIYLKDIKSNYSKVKALSSLIGYRSAQFITANVMEPVVGEDCAIKKGSVDFIVTSPPYPNAFDYHLYHRFRIFWLDGDPREMGKVEIGSHLNYQRGHKSFEQFEKEMYPVLKNCFEALKAGRYAAFVLGDAVFNGEEYRTAQKIGLLAESLGFINLGIIDRPLPENKRSVKSWARRATTEQILVLRKPSEELKITLNPVQYKLWPYEKIISNMERKVITNFESDVFCCESSFDIGKLKRLTFYNSFQCNETLFPTWQKILEQGTETDGSTRKDPKYLTHGIHPYKGKFYPQLVRPLLNILEIPKGGVVFDPFCGSGTVALEAILNGYDAYGCDINPIAVEIATAKNTIFTVSPYNFEKQVSLFRQELLNYHDGDYSTIFDTEAIDEIKRWFPSPVISKMGYILCKIACIPDERIRCFLRVILSSIIREISQQEPSDLRIRRRKEELSDAPVIEMYAANLDKQYNNIMDFYKVRNMAPTPIGRAHIWRGNSTDVTGLKKALPSGGVDIVITSPPYATALPYIDTNRLNMLVLHGLNSSRRMPIEAEMTGTREINKTTRQLYEEKIRHEDYGDIISPTAIQIISKIYLQNSEADVGFRKKNMASLIYMYFSDITKVLQSLNEVVKQRGYICIVIGDTKTMTGSEKVIIRTTEVLRETGQKLGWTLVKDIPISVTKENYIHMNNSITENNILIFQR